MRPVVIIFSWDAFIVANMCSRGSTELSAVSRVPFAIERIAAVLNAVDLLLVHRITHIPVENIVVVAAKVVTPHRTFAGPEAEPLGNAALLATRRERVPVATVERPAAVCHALASGSRFDAILADVKACLLA